MSGVEAARLYQSLEEFFQPERFTDLFPVGIQHHNTDRIERVYLSTFASVPVLRQALDRNAPDSLLFTHHPVPPKPDEDGAYGTIPEEILAEMREKRLSLFSYHIAMDCNGTYSPSRSLARALGLEEYATFYPQNGGEMGILSTGSFATFEELAKKLAEVLGHEVGAYRYGEDRLEYGRVALMPGGARSTEIYRYLREQGVNTFVTGVTNPRISWVKAIHEEAKKNGVNLLGGTHYSTEMFAPRAMADFFREFGLESEYLSDQANLLDL